MPEQTGVNWFTGRTPLDLWVHRYEQWTRDLVNLVFDLVAARADEIREWMKENHVWKNRTRLAEERLNTAVRRDVASVTLYMYHGADVPYSRFLERYMQAGRFSVLRPALDYWGAVILADLRKALHP